jgi:hypothetical protein
MANVDTQLRRKLMRSPTQLVLTILSGRSFWFFFEAEVMEQGGKIE